LRLMTSYFKMEEKNFNAYRLSFTRTEKNSLCLLRIQEVSSYT